MKTIVGDFETYYDNEYSLKNLTPIEYILDDRFETICCALAVNNEPPIFFPRSSVVNYLRNQSEPYAFVSHNALFDAAILAYRYNIHPPILIDTLGLCRAHLSHELRSLRLADVLHHFKLSAKGTTLKDVKGMRFDDIIRQPQLWEQFEAYNMRDCEGCREIYQRLLPLTPARELRVMDTIIRMVTQPKLLLDLEKLNHYYTQVVAYKDSLLTYGFPRETYMSNDKFAQTLKWFGVEPPLKYSTAKDEMTWAFARTDADFMVLQEHPDEMVQKLMEARLGLKTTIEETRTKRFLNIATVTINSWGEARLPVPLKYSGAHTHRLSGDWKLNMQNLSARKQKTLREAIIAPKDHYIIAIDAKQIEARLVAWLAGQKDLVEAFRRGVDTYTDFAAAIYRKNPEDVTKIERFTGKTCILGLGFGMSDSKLLLSLRLAAREAGFNVEYTEDQTREWVRLYRSRFVNILYLWDFGRSIITHMSIPFAGDWSIGPCKVVNCGTKSPAILLPSGLKLFYHGLKYNKPENEFIYQYAGRPKKIYGAKLIENIVQALDRQFVIDAAMRTETRCRREGMDIKLALQLHDENVYCVPREYGKRLTMIAYEEMSRPPPWGLDFPAAAEIKYGKNYADLIELKMPKIENLEAA